MGLEQAHSVHGIARIESKEHAYDLAIARQVCNYRPEKYVDLTPIVA